MYDNKRNLYFIGLSLLFMGSKANKVHLQLKGAVCLTIFWGYYRIKWVFNHVSEKLYRKGGIHEKLSIAMENKNIVGRYVFAIDKSDGTSYFVKLSNDF